MERCSYCDWLGPVISDEEFSEGKDLIQQVGVIWTIDAYAKEIYDDYTKSWECNECFWERSWAI